MTIQNTMDTKEKNHEFMQGFITKAVHVGQEHDPSTGAIVPPVHLSSTYEVYADQPSVF